MSTHLSTPIKQLTRVGAITAARLAKLGIGSVLDLLNHYPTRYEDYSARLSTASLSIGALGTMFGTIGSIETKKTAKIKKRKLSGIIFIYISLLTALLSIV